MQGNHLSTWMSIAASFAVMLPVSADERRPTSGPAAPDVLRIARSIDGMRFTDTGHLLLKDAGAPDLLVWPDGRIVAVFDQHPSVRGGADSRMAFAVSADSGNHWSAARPVRFEGNAHPGVIGRHPDLVRTADGQVRLYFESSPASSSQHGSTPTSRLRTAVCTDGNVFQLDNLARLPRTTGRHPMTVRREDNVHLYLAESGNGVGTTTRHFLSRDGRQFAALASSFSTRTRFVGSICPVGNQLRAYVSARGGIRSLVSRDGRTWTPDAGVRVGGGWDPAVARLRDGSYLMIYCASGDATTPSARELAGGVSSQGQPATSPATQSATHAASHGPFGSLRTAPASSTVPGRLTADRFLAFLAAGPGAQTDADRLTPTDAGGGVFGDWLTVMDDLAEPVLAPAPDFTDEVDYLQWYTDVLLTQPHDNAFEVYAGFMPGPWHESTEQHEWPELRNMIAERGSRAAPMPWNPDDHPAWEASRVAARELLAGFREASTHTGYAQPPYFSADPPSESRPAKGLLFEMVLPNLQRHRNLARETLAEGWRIEDGDVSADRLIDSMETVLRNSHHLSQGATVIELLVAEYEQRLVQRTAMRALELEVFSADEMETSLEMLRKHDRDPSRLRYVMRGEYAACMDTMQFLFMPDDRSGTPVLNEDHARYLAEYVFGAEAETMIDSLRGLGPDDIRRSVNDIRTYHEELGRQIDVGYPDVRRSDVHATWERFAESSPVADSGLFLFADLSRVVQMHTTTESARRATQLSHELHLFKARHGRWPASLTELPDDHGGARTRIDPFTGREYAYRLGPDGPRLYSLSENGIDDGGVHREHLNRADPAGTDSKDYVYWPPQWEE